MRELAVFRMNTINSLYPQSHGQKQDLFGQYRIGHREESCATVQTTSRDGILENALNKNKRGHPLPAHNECAPPDGCLHPC